MKRLAIVILLAARAVAQLSVAETERQVVNLREQVSALAAQEDAVKARLARLRLSYTDTYPDIVSLQQQLAGLQAQESIFRDRESQLRANQGGRGALAQMETYSRELSLRRATLEAQLKSLRQTDNEASPEVQSVQKQLLELQSQEATVHARIGALAAEIDVDKLGQAIAIPLRERWWRRSSTVQSLASPPTSKRKWTTSSSNSGSS